MKWHYSVGATVHSLTVHVFSPVSAEDIVGREVQRVDGSHRSQNCRSAEDQPATVSRLVNCTSSSALHCQLQIIVNSISLSAATHCQPHLIVSYTFIATLHCQLHVISRTSWVNLIVSNTSLSAAHGSTSLSVPSHQLQLTVICILAAASYLRLHHIVNWISFWAAAYCQLHFINCISWSAAPYSQMHLIHWILTVNCTSQTTAPHG